MGLKLSSLQGMYLKYFVSLYVYTYTALTNTFIHSMQLSFYLGGDWKFLALVTGIDAATSDYACIWCKCPKKDRWDTSVSWSITNTDEGARCGCVYYG